MPDYIFMLESRLSPGQVQALTRVQQEAQELSLNIYLVGGAVRDLMTGSPIRDLDFAVEGNPLKLVRRLQAGKSLQVRIDELSRSVEVILGNGVSLSVEMARSESYEAPGRPSHIAPAPILEDLRRRDFSVNSMGISLTPGSRGLLLDPTNGLADIENRELRVLHNYSFVHDPIRLLRLVRFASRLGFRPEDRTQELFEAALERGYQRCVTAGALGREVEQIALEENVVLVLKVLAEKELLEVLHPELQKRKPDYDGLAKFQKYRQQAEATGYQLNPFVAVVHYVLKRLKGRTGRQMLRNLGMKKTMVKRVLGIEKEARGLVKLLSRRRKITPREVYKVLTPVSFELMVFVLAEFSGRKKVQSKVYNYLFKYRPLRNQLPVRELQLMGVAPGSLFDQVLERYFEAQLDGKLRDRAQQLRYLRKLAGLPKPESRKDKSKKPVAPKTSAEPSASPPKAPLDRKAARKSSVRSGRSRRQSRRAAKRKARKVPRKVAGKRKKSGRKTRARKKARSTTRRKSRR
jgi:tRNA nucleotidyltransferase/poly(A) polymerase